MNEELSTQRTPEIIAAEIRGYTGMMLSAVIEIGRRLVEVKAMLPHGEFLPWVEENTGYKKSTANNFMRLFEAYGERQGSLFGAEVANSKTFGNLNYSKALALLSVPENERDAFAEEHDVEAMTTKELQEAIRERDEAKRAAEYSEKKLGELNRDFEASQTALLDEKARTKELYAQIKELENRPVEVAVREPSADEVEKAAAELANKAIAEAAKDAQAKIAEMENKLHKAQEAEKKAKDKLKTAGADAEKKSAADIEAAKKAEADARAEVEKLRAELTAAKDAAAQAKIAGDGELALVKSYAEELIGYANKLNGIRKKAQVHGDEALAGKVRALLENVAEQIGGLAK